MLTTFVIALVVVILDQLLKIWVASHLLINESMKLLPNILNITYIHNTGAGWGIFAGQRQFLIMLTLLVIIYLIYLTWRNQNYSFLSKLSYGLLLGGAVGNLIDRLWQGYVVDMLQLGFIDFPIFNLADIALSVGVMLLIGMVIWTKEGSDLI